MSPSKKLAWTSALKYERALSCCFVFLVCAAVGCASVSRNKAATVALKLDAEHYSIGQPLVATVSVKNDSSSRLIIPSMDSNTLKFYLVQEGQAVPIRRWPVLPKGASAEPHILQPGGSAERSFLFTQATAEPGKWWMITSISNYITDDQEFVHPLFSSPVWFCVSDDVKLKRDPYSGIILKDQAVELARMQAKASAHTPARAVLVPLGDSGLVMWTVVFNGEAETAQQEWFSVNPYTGKVEPITHAEGGEKW